VIFDFFVMGVCQTAVGALIPDIERFYRLSDGATASLFVAHMGGYLCATAVTQHLHLRLGRRGIALLAPLFRLSAAAILSTGPCFTVALATYSLFGLGTGLADAGWCAWASSLPYANICQGMMHGAFSTGCVVGPIAALAVLKKGFDWYGFYRFAVSHRNISLRRVQI
jgi:fucose permease